VVAFRGPAYSDTTKTNRRLISWGLWLSVKTQTYQRLVLKEQKVDQLSVSFEIAKDQNFSPSLLA